MESGLKDNNREQPTIDTSPKFTEVRRIVRILLSRWIVIGSMIILFLFLLFSAIGPLIAPHDPLEANLLFRLKQPTREYLLGTDALGRDVLSRMIYGTRISLMVGVVATSISAIIGMWLGLIAGYIGGRVNDVIMRFIDALMAIPPLILSLSIAAALGGGIKNVMISLGIAMIPTYCRLMCGQVLSIKETDYVLAAKISGASATRIMLRHLLINAFPPLLVLITLNIGMAILIESGLSFLGIGILPPNATWGRMVSEGYTYMMTNPVQAFVPGFAIMIVVLAFNIVGDGLRDALDPRLRGTL